MSKPSRGKTETIKQRALYIYLPTTEMAEDWKRRADEDRISVSKFVMLKVLDSLEFGEGSSSREQLLKEVKEQQKQKEEALEENEKLRQENRMLKMLSDNLDKELRRLRTQPFLEAGFVGKRKFDKGLIDILKSGKGVETDRILARLHIDPSDSELIKGVRKQLEALQAYELIEYDGRWWKWKG